MILASKDGSSVVAVRGL